MEFGDFDGDGLGDWINFVPGSGLVVGRSDGVRFVASEIWNLADQLTSPTLHVGD